MFGTVAAAAAASRSKLSLITGFVIVKEERSGGHRSGTAADRRTLAGRGSARASGEGNAEEEKREGEEGLVGV